MPLKLSQKAELPVRWMIAHDSTAIALIADFREALWRSQFPFIVLSIGSDRIGKST
jgi:hypothetical protein